MRSPMAQTIWPSAAVKPRLLLLSSGSPGRVIWPPLSSLSSCPVLRLVPRVPAVLAAVAEAAPTWPRFKWVFCHGRRVRGAWCRSSFGLGCYRPRLSWLYVLPGNLGYYWIMILVLVLVLVNGADGVMLVYGWGVCTKVVCTIFELGASWFWCLPHGLMPATIRRKCRGFSLCSIMREMLGYLMCYLFH